MTTPDPSTTGTVLGEGAALALTDTLDDYLMMVPEDEYPSASGAFTSIEPVVARLLSAAREQGAAAEREAILTELAEFEAEAKAVQIKDDLDNARIVGVQDAALIIRQRRSS